MKPKKDHDSLIPPQLDKLAGYSWRILVILGMISVVIFLIMTLKTVVIPFFIALLVTAMLFPVTNWMVKKKVKKGLAVAISLVALVAIVSGLTFAFVKQVQIAYPSLKDRFMETVQNASSVLSAEPFNISTTDLSNFGKTITEYIQNNSGQIISGVSTAGTTAGHVGAGLMLTIFAVIFLLYDGKNIWKWFTKLIPRTSRQKFDEAGQKGWRTLTEFVKSQVMVAGVDALGIGLGALLLGVPLAIPIALIVFLGSFIPIVGAIITGMIAVSLALIFNGWLIALIMLGVVLLVQFFEGHVLQPFLIGKAVKVHPLAIVFAVAAGSLLAGIPGALFAVPVVAVLNVMLGHIFKPSV